MLPVRLAAQKLLCCNLNSGPFSNRPEQIGRHAATNLALRPCPDFGRFERAPIAAGASLVVLDRRLDFHFLKQAFHTLITKMPIDATQTAIVSSAYVIA